MEFDPIMDLRNKVLEKMKKHSFSIKETAQQIKISYNTFLDFFTMRSKRPHFRTFSLIEKWLKQD